MGELSNPRKEHKPQVLIAGFEYAVEPFQRIPEQRVCFRRVYGVQ